VLPAFFAGARWFAEKGSKHIETSLETAIALGDGDHGPVLAFFAVSTEHGKSRYALPLAIRWIRSDRAADQLGRQIVAPVRRGAREGVLIDAGADRDFVASLIAGIHTGARLEGNGPLLECRPAARFADAPLAAIEMTHAVGTEQSNTTILIGGAFVLKIYRHIEPGLNPEIEIGRFLTEVAGFANAPPCLGSVELVAGDERFAVATLHGFVDNQGDAWSLTAAYLDRFLDELKVLSAEEHSQSAEHAAYLPRMQQIGRRVAEMALALNSHDDDPAFAPEPIEASDLARWRETLVRSASRQFDHIARRLPQLPESVRTAAAAFLARREAALSRIGDLLPSEVDAVKTRHHGDFHLGQILIVKDDVFVIDFEGEPRRSIAERRRKAPAARDVAGLIRSIDYATTAALGRAIPTSPDETARLEHALDEWRRRSRETFLAAYRETLGATRLWPREPGAAERLLEFFILEKLIYEIGYELANRPDWLQVPLAGALRMLFPNETIES